MREQRSCDGCGSERFFATPGLAAEVGAQPVEVILWRCGGCGGETVVLDPVDGGLLEATGSARRAA